MNEKMIANYHTHTIRCHHAAGTDQEYVEAALQAGLHILGFSDHAPFIRPDGIVDSFRISEEDLPDYLQSIQDLKEQYQGQIEIHMGFEAEFYEPYYKEMLGRLKNLGAEYLILGEHQFFGKNSFYRPCTQGTTDPELLDEYVRACCQGMKSGYFLYLAHPDMMKFDGPTDQYLEHMRPICTTARELGMPLEMNLWGARLKRHYPNEAFWQMAGEEHVKVVIGCDCHNPKYFLPKEEYNMLLSWANLYHLDLLKTLDL